MTLRRSMALLALIVASALMVGCHDDTDSETSSSTAPGSPRPRVALGGAGSTFIGPIMTEWIADFTKLHPDVVINYRPIGSGKGIEEFQQHLLSFGATDAALNDEQLQKTPAVQIPVTAGPVCVIYNLPGLNAPLRLSANTLAGIYLGKIVSWQDPLIARDNPGVHIPKAPVIVVHRADGSGTTSILTTYLSKISGDWTKQVGHGTSVTWPVGIVASGSQGIVDLLKQTRGTIGYAELNYANENKMTVASIQNRAGSFQAPSPAGTLAAITAFQEALAADVRTPIVDPPASAKDAYPISGLSFLLLPTDSPTTATRPDLLQFISYVLGDGQNSAERLAYSTLPESLKRVDMKLMSTLNGASEAAR